MTYTKLEEAKDILVQLGLPKKQQNDRSAVTLLALLNLKEDNSWNEAEENLIGMHGIIQFANNYYGFNYKENTRESIRRYSMHQFIQANLSEKNPDDLTRPINSEYTVYGVTEEALKLIKSYKTSAWKGLLEKFLIANKKLTEKYSKKRKINQIPVKIEGQILNFSPGKHNDLQKKVIEEFAPRFAPGAEVLYIGDTADKFLFFKEEKLKELGIPVGDKTKLPDVVIYCKKKNWLYLVEAVTSHGPMSPKRILEIEDFLEKCEAGPVFVTALLDRKTYKKYAADIAWETEVWIADNPEHMIHYNGDRFLGPHK